MKQILAALTIFLLAAAGHGAETDLTVTSGSCTMTISKYDTSGASSIWRYDLIWTSDGGGNVVAALPRIHGTIRCVITNPGSAAPTDDYDVTLYDSDGLDVLVGLGANRDTANSERFVPLVGDGTTTQQLVTVASELDLAITNAGNAKDGVLSLIIER